MNYNSQIGQDKFVLNVLNNKKRGFFVEIGSNHPITINNSYILENENNWTGIMVEFNNSYLPLYKQHRPNSIHIINDATQIDYKTLFETNSVPLCMDYLQIDLEVNNGSTLKVLQKLDNDVFDTYKFATVTFEHDIYHTNFDNTREESRKIFEKRGYKRVLEDIHYAGNPFEDWYVHPDLVNMDYIRQLQELNKNNYEPKYIAHIDCVVNSINWENIMYLE